MFLGGPQLKKRTMRNMITDQQQNNYDTIAALSRTQQGFHQFNQNMIEDNTNYRTGNTGN